MNNKYNPTHDKIIDNFEIKFLSYLIYFLKQYQEDHYIFDSSIKCSFKLKF